MLAGAGAIFGGSFALDQTMRSHLSSMSSSDADLLQNVSEGAGIATLIDIGIKAGFGRLRPSQTGSHTAFFDDGQSFVSGDVTPMFALGAGVSEYYDNRWHIAVPIYSLAQLDGFGRMETTSIGSRT